VLGLAPWLPAAGASSEAVRLSYSAAAACPSGAEFESAVRARLRRGRVADAGELAREYRVVVTPHGTKHVARLSFVDPAGSAIVREVSADGCAEAVRAMALVTALAIDAVVPEDPRPVAPTAAASSNGATQQGPRAAGPQPSPAAAPADQPPDPLPPFTRGPPPSTPWRQPRLALGARATLTTAKAPDPLFGAELFAALEGSGSGWLVHLGLAGERGARFRSDPGEARFSFLGGRLEGCWSFALASGLRALPCALFEAGAVVAEGFSDESRTVVDPWMATGPTARLDLDWGPGKAALEGGVLFPLTYRDRTIFGDLDSPQATVHDVPTAGAFAALGISLDLE
jgi:hypothetical protein